MKSEEENADRKYRDVDGYVYRVLNHVGGRSGVCGVYFGLPGRVTRPYNGIKPGGVAVTQARLDLVAKAKGWTPVKEAADGQA